MEPVELKSLRAQFRTELSGLYPLPETDSIFYLLIEDYFGFPRTILAMEPEKKLDTAGASRLLRALDELKAHRPVQHILGHAYFMGMQLRVSPDVLIPRPETEELVAWITGQFRDRTTGTRILDVGTGSGCIALGLKKYLPDSEVIGLDISHAALQIARHNAELQGLQVSFVQGDVRNPAPGLAEFDAIASNPPYVPLSEAAAMQKHVRFSEPHLALFVPDEDPLLFYRHLCEFADTHLKSGGWIFLETHERYAQAVGRLLEDRGYARVEVKKDIFDKDRFVRGIRRGQPEKGIKLKKGDT